MKRYAAPIATALAATVSLPAYAGSVDEPMIEAAPAVVAPAPVMPASPDWTGPYIGGQLGFANIDTNAAGIDGDGAIGGIIAGYDYDFGDFVIGGGLDYDFTDIDLGGGVNVDSVWRVKLRGGYKLGNGLLYATGGYAGADTSPFGDEDGYFVGAGYEHMVMENVSLGGEVLYHEFENVGTTTTDVEATTVQVRASFRF